MISFDAKDTPNELGGDSDTHRDYIHENVSVLNIFLDVHSEGCAHHGLQKQFFINHIIVGVCVG